MLITKVHYFISPKGICHFLKGPIPGSSTHVAKWKEPKVKFWRQIINKPNDQRFVDPYTFERRIWEYLLLDSTLLHDKPGLQIRNEDETLTEEALDVIMKTRPAKVAARLVQPVIKETYLSSIESERIKRDCQTLWIGKGAKLDDPHPMTEEAVMAMVFKERYGIPMVSSVDEMHQKVYQVYKLVSSTYSDIMDLNSHADEQREKAAKMAGVRGS
jgi:hypothetical protein